MMYRNAATALIVLSGSWITHLCLTASFGPGASKVQHIPPTNAIANGCRDGGPGGINRTNPSWVRVVLNDHRKKILEGFVVGSHVTHEDFPFNHDSHDMNSFIIPDAPYVGLMSEANVGTLSSRDHRHMMEVEWESKYYPIPYWPVTGDRAWIIGRHVFDCGHPPARTEIHPPVGAAYTRSGAMILPGDSTPSFVNRTFIFFGNQGGYFVDKVGGQDYIFNVPFPRSPGGGATPRFLVLSRPFGGLPSPVLTPKMVGSTQMLEVRVPLSGVSDPTVRWDLYEQIKRGLPTNNRPTNVLAYGAVIATSWTRGKTSLFGTPGFRMVRVQFQNIKVHDDRDTGKGEWNMYVRANHEWIKVPEKAVNDGDTIPINQFVDVFLPDNGTVEIQCTGWEDDNDGYFRVGSPPGIGQLGALNENELLPEIIMRHSASQNFGIGQQSINANPRNYTLNYTITELRKFPGTPGTTIIKPGGGLIRPPARTTGGGGHN